MPQHAILTSLRRSTLWFHRALRQSPCSAPGTANALAAALLLFGAAQAQTMPPVRVVPGSSVGYLYFPASSDSKSLLKVTKQGTFTRYAITYQKGDDAPETLCAETDLNCEIALPSSLVTLSVKGYFGTGTSAKILAAEWGGDCTASGNANCKLPVSPGDNQFVRVTVACDGSAASVVQMGSDEGLCLGLHESSYIVAAHKHAASGRKPKNVIGTWANTDATDGRNNMSELLSRMSASQAVSSAHYCNTLSVGGLNGWYLPASGELNVMGARPAPAVYGTYYASTARSHKHNYRMTYSSSGKSLSSSTYNSSSNYSTLCVQRVEPRL